MKPDPLSSACNSCQDHQEHISSYVLNITNTCLYQACTNITTYHHKICVSSKYQPVPCINMYLYHQQVHQPCTKPVSPLVPQQVHQPCTNTCIINHVPTMYMHIKLYHIKHVHRPCTSTINTCTIPCANHVHQPTTYHIP
jgi:hypothetical protein